MRLQLIYFHLFAAYLFKKKNIVHKALIKIIKNISINVSKSISKRRGILIKKCKRERN